MSVKSPPHARSGARQSHRPKLLVSLLVLAGAVTLISGVPASAQEPAATRTASGPTGQVLTVTPADGLALVGSSVEVTGTGYDPMIGIYLALCVDNGAEVSPGPCVGGAPMSGGAGASFWISSNPPSYAVGLTTPFGASGDFELTMSLSSSDEFVDCLDPEVRCVVATRADHTNPGVHSADVRVPVSFVGQDPITDVPVDGDNDGNNDTKAPPASTDGDVPGTPTATTVPEPAYPTPVVDSKVLSAADTTATDSMGSAKAAQTLAFTGSSSWWLTALALVLIASGFALTRMATPATPTQRPAIALGKGRAR